MAVDRFCYTAASLDVLVVHKVWRSLKLFLFAYARNDGEEVAVKRPSMPIVRLEAVAFSVRIFICAISLRTSPMEKIAACPLGEDRLIFLFHSVRISLQK